MIGDLYSWFDALPCTADTAPNPVSPVHKLRSSSSELDSSFETTSSSSGFRPWTPDRNPSSSRSQRLLLNSWCQFIEVDTTELHDDWFHMLLAFYGVYLYVMHHVSSKPNLKTFTSAKIVGMPIFLIKAAYDSGPCSLGARDNEVRLSCSM